MFPVHASSFIGKKEDGSPVFQSSGSAQANIVTALFQADVVFGGDEGSNQLLVAMYFSEAASSRVHSAPKYNGVAGTLAGQITLDNVQALAISASYWKNGQIPSSSGTYEFEMTLSGNNRGHAVRMFLLKDVDQTTPIGTLITGTVSDGVPTFVVTQNITNSKGKGVIIALGAAVNGPTYVGGDFSDNGSNFNGLNVQIPRNPSTPGGAFGTAQDIIPDTNEDYKWDIKYGSATTVEAVVHMLVPINGASV